MTVTTKSAAENTFENESSKQNALSSPSLISFFHISPEYRVVFSSPSPKRPCFYWFSDRFHSHYGYPQDGWYIYFFVVDPAKDKVSLRARAGAQNDFNDLYTDFARYKENVLQQVSVDKMAYTEPPVVMSFDTIVPSLVAQYDKVTNEFVVVLPTEHKGKRFELFERCIHLKEWPRPKAFVEIPTLMQVLPMLSSSLPLELPKTEGGEYMYDRWLPMNKPKGIWL